MSVRRRLARAAAMIDSLDDEFSEIRRIANDTAPRKIRSEGLSESLGEFEFSMDARPIRLLQSGDSSMADFTMYFNVSVVTDGGQENDPILVVEDSVGSKPFQGEFWGSNGVTFRNAFPSIVEKDLRFVRCRVRGIRVNANMLSGSGSIPSFVSGAIFPNGTTDPAGALSMIEIAAVERGLFADLTPDNSTEQVEGWVSLTLRCLEGFAGAFKTEIEETGDERQRRYGTRLFVRLLNIPDGCEVWTSVKSQDRSSQTEDRLAVASLIETDIYGAGRVGALAGERHPLPGRLGHLTFHRAKSFGSTRYAVWEVVSESSYTGQPREFRFRIMVPSEAWSGENPKFSIGLAPLSPLSRAPRNDNLPRFADTGSIAPILSVRPVPGRRGIPTD